ncbi:MAG: hypothetical protein ABR555_05215 [Pyrinomonadaceae bacterium]
MTALSHRNTPPRLFKHSAAGKEILMKRLIQIITVTGICLVLISAVEAQKPKKPLLGANGQRLELGQKPPAGIELVEARIYESEEQLRSDAPLHPRFSTGIAKLRLAIDLKSEGPPKADITFEVLSDSGRIKIKDGYAVYSAVPADHKYSASYPLEPEAGPYPNGAYQLRLLMDGKVVALLNWSVGDQ